MDFLAALVPAAFVPLGALRRLPTTWSASEGERVEARRTPSGGVTWSVSSRRLLPVPGASLSREGVLPADVRAGSDAAGVAEGCRTASAEGALPVGGASTAELYEAPPTPAEPPQVWASMMGADEAGLNAGSAEVHTANSRDEFAERAELAAWMNEGMAEERRLLSGARDEMLARLATLQNDRLNLALAPLDLQALPPDPPSPVWMTCGTAVGAAIGKVVGTSLREASSGRRPCSDGTGLMCDGIGAATGAAFGALIGVSMGRNPGVQIGRARQQRKDELAGFDRAIEGLRERVRDLDLRIASRRAIPAVALRTENRALLR